MNAASVPEGFCTSCGATLAAEATAFCLACGAPLRTEADIQSPPVEVETVAAQTTQASRFCMECGHPVADNVAYCKECGSRLEAPAAKSTGAREFALPRKPGLLVVGVATIVVLVLSLALAGVLPIGGALGGGMTAKEARAVADAEARAWDASPRLVTVFGAEGKDITLYSPAARHSDFLVRFVEEDSRDSVLGDGRARVWNFAYVNSGRTANLELLIQDGRVVQREIGRQGGSASVGDWTVDSDAAVRAVLQAAPEWRNATLFLMGLTYAEKYGHAGWAITSNRGRSYVDAMSGEVIGVYTV